MGGGGEVGTFGVYDGVGQVALGGEECWEGEGLFGGGRGVLGIVDCDGRDWH